MEELIVCNAAEPRLAAYLRMREMYQLDNRTDDRILGLSTVQLREFINQFAPNTAQMVGSLDMVYSKTAMYMMGRIKDAFPAGTNTVRWWADCEEDVVQPNLCVAAKRRMRDGGPNRVMSLQECEDAWRVVAPRIEKLADFYVAHELLSEEELNGAVYFAFHSHKSDPSRNINGDMQYLKRYGTKLSSEWGRVEECFTRVNAIKAVQLRKLDMAAYVGLSRYLSEWDTKDPDAFIGSMLDQVLRVAREGDMQTEEMQRHAERMARDQPTRLETCNDFFKWGKCEYGDDCKFVHALRKNK